MNMDKRRLLIFLIIFALISVGGLLFTQNRLPNARPGASAASSNNINQAVANPPTPANLSLLEKTEMAAAVIKRRLHQKSEIEKGKDQWRTPIEFYGKIIDQSGSPVAGVGIVFSCNDISIEGTSLYKKTSADDGSFSISRVKGKFMMIKLSKDGYYSSKNDNYGFEYGDPYEHFVPDPKNPVIFHLRKKGKTDPLIAINGGMRWGKTFVISKNGDPEEISLTTGKQVQVGQGDFRVECLVNNDGKAHRGKYDWKCTVSVPNGGIQPYSEEFPFNAPQSGYQSAGEISMYSTNANGWSSSVKRNYFVHLSNGNYARVTFEIFSAGDHFFEIESFLNPTGSRNLEFDPSNSAQVTQ